MFQIFITYYYSDQINTTSRTELSQFLSCDFQITKYFSLVMLCSLMASLTHYESLDVVNLFNFYDPQNIFLN